MAWFEQSITSKRFVRFVWRWTKSDRCRQDRWFLQVVCRRWLQSGVRRSSDPGIVKWYTFNWRYLIKFFILKLYRGEVGQTFSELIFFVKKRWQPLEIFKQNPFPLEILLFLIHTTATGKVWKNFVLLSFLDNPVWNFYWYILNKGGYGKVYPVKLRYLFFNFFLFFLKKKFWPHEGYFE